MGILVKPSLEIQVLTTASTIGMGCAPPGGGGAPPGGGGAPPAGGGVVAPPAGGGVVGSVALPLAASSASNPVKEDNNHD